MFCEKLRGIVFIALLLSPLLLAAETQPVKAAGGTVYIRTDGSVDPPTAPIQRNGNNYALTSNITTDFDGIVIERDGIVIDGSGYTLLGPGSAEANGIALVGRRDVTIKNMRILHFLYGVYLSGATDNWILDNQLLENNNSGIWLTYSSSNNVISANNVSSNYAGIALQYSVFNRVVENYIHGNTATGVAAYSSSDNIIMRNEIASNSDGVICHWQSKRNVIVGNNITANRAFGVSLEYSQGNKVIRNNITNNGAGVYGGIYLHESWNNTIYHNNFEYNSAHQAYIYNSISTWDDGYPSGGNYWRDYAGVDMKKGADQDQPGSDGIGDTPYVISTDQAPIAQDNYPFMESLSGFRWVWGDDDGDGVPNYLDVSSLNVSPYGKSGQILGFEWSYMWSSVDPGNNVQMMLNEFSKWGTVVDIGTPKHICSAVLDIDGIGESIAQLRSQAPYVIPQEFVDWMNSLACGDGNLRYLVVLHSDVEISDVSGLLATLGKALSDPKSFESWFDLAVYTAGMFGFELYRLHGIDQVKTDLLLDTTGFSSFFEEIALLKDAAGVTRVLEKVVTVLSAVAAGAAAPASLPVLVAGLAVKFFAFVIDFMEWKWEISNLVLDQIQAVLTMADPPAEKVVLQLFDSASQNLVLGYNSTSGQDIGAFPYGFYVSDNDSALLIVARNSADYRLTD